MLEVNLTPSKEGLIRGYNLRKVLLGAACLTRGACGMDRGSLHRKASVVPRSKTTFERSHFFNASALQKQRHTGAGRFVRSGAEQNDLAVAWNLIVTFFNIVWRQADCAGNCLWFGLEIECTSQVDDHHFFSRFDLPSQLLGSDARDSQAVDESPALNVLPAYVSRESSDKNHKQREAEARDARGHLFKLVAEHKSEADEGADV